MGEALDRFAFDAGVNVACVIPTRLGNGAWMLSPRGVTAARSRSKRRWITAWAAARSRLRRSVGPPPFFKLCSVSRAAAATPARNEPFSARPAAHYESPAVKADFDVAIVGSGFSGSLLAMIAKRLGHRSSSSSAVRIRALPSANRQRRSQTCCSKRLRRPTTFPGSVHFANGDRGGLRVSVACGLKRGFTFYHHEFDQPWARRPDRANELLVAASPHDEVADTHWYRAEFDEFLVREAQSRESKTSTKLNLLPFRRRLWACGSKARGEQSASTFKPVSVDATGPRGFLHRAFGLPESRSRTFRPSKVSSRISSMCIDGMTSCLARARPYPPDDAAVHHVFPGGWIWVLRVGNGITSAGVAAVADGRLTSRTELAGKNCWTACPRCANSSHTPGQRCRSSMPRTCRFVQTL